MCRSPYNKCRQMRIEKYTKVIVFLMLFVGSNVIGKIGFSDNFYNVSMIGMAIIPLAINYRDWSQNHYSLLLLLFVVIFAMFKIYIDRGEGTRVLSMSILGAPILYLCIPNAGRTIHLKNIFIWRSIIRLVLMAFAINCFIAYLERIMGYNFFGINGGSIMQIAESGQASFRCAAIYGHPLKNALLTSTALGFVLVSSLKLKYKYMLWISGYIAILCFNTRSSMVGEIVMLLVYLLYFVLGRKNRFQTKMLVILSSAFVIMIACFLVRYGYLGGRLLVNGLNDDSSQVRITIWDIFKRHSVGDFMFGLSHSDVEYMKYLVGVRVIENFWLVFLFRFGFIFLIVYVVIYFLFLKSVFRQYKTFDKLFVTLNFLLIASTNNSLASGFMTLWYFLLLATIFNPILFKLIVPRKWLK